MPLLALIPGIYRWAALAILIASLAIGIPLAKHHYDATQQKVGYDKRAAEDKAASDQQAAANRDLQRAAELKYVVRRDVQAKVFDTATKEIHEAASPMASCPVPDAVRVRLNSLSECASSDSPTACGADGQVSAP